MSEKGICSRFGYEQRNKSPFFFPRLLFQLHIRRIFTQLLVYQSQPVWVFRTV